jgi:hypothetical protein
MTCFNVLKGIDHCPENEERGKWNLKIGGGNVLNMGVLVFSGLLRLNFPLL